MEENCVHFFKQDLNLERITKLECSRSLWKMMWASIVDGVGDMYIKYKSDFESKWMKEFM